MKTFKEFINEQGNYKVYMIDKTLWLASGEGSGTTSEIRNMNTFLTNKDGDKNYDSIVDDVVNKFLKYTAPQMKKRSSDKMTHYSLYYLPAYKYADTKQGKIEAWSGEIKPFETNYMLVVQGEDYDILQFFKTKNEAIAILIH